MQVNYSVVGTNDMAVTTSSMTSSLGTQAWSASRPLTK